MKVFATFHPTSVLAGGYNLEAYIRDDLARFRQKQLRPPNKKLPAPTTTTIGFDTEYDPTGKLLTVGLSDLSRAAAIETTERGWRRIISPIIRGAKRVAGHSVDGDLDYLVRQGLAKEKWLRGIDIRDSLLLARMLDENKGKGGYGLEPLFLAEFSATPWKQPTADLLKKMPDASLWPVALRTERCRLDAWATRMLAEKCYRAVKEQTESVRKERLR